jgi:hypothetical protein
MGLTSLAPVVTALQPTYTTLPNWGSVYTVSAITVTNTTDFLYTFTSNHNFKIGQTVTISNVVYTGNSPNQVALVKTVPAANQITLYIAASPSISYTSGGTATGISLSVTPKQTSFNSSGFAKYVNSKFFYGDYYGNLFYSNDGITWSWTVPSRGGVPTNNAVGYYNLADIDWDGSVYAVVDSWGNISTTPDLVTWTSRVSGTGSSAYFTKVKWCGGSYQAWVAIGSNTGNSYILYTAPSGGATWTSRTISGANALTGIDFDGNTTVAVVGYYYSSGYLTTLAYSTNAATWTYNSGYTTVPISDIFYNANNGVWYIQSTFSNTTYTSKTTAQLSNTTAQAVNDTTVYPTKAYPTVSSNGANNDIPYNGSRKVVDTVNNLLFMPSFTGNFFVDNKYSWNPTVTSDPLAVSTNGGYAFSKLAENAYPVVENNLPYGYNSQILSSLSYYIWSGTKWVLIAPNGSAPSAGAIRVVVLQ